MSGENVRDQIAGNLKGKPNLILWLGNMVFFPWIALPLPNTSLVQKWKSWNVILPSADDRSKLSFSCPYNSCLQFQLPFFLKKGLSLVFIWVPGPRSHSCWALVCGPFFHSSWYSSVEREDKRTNLGRKMEGRRELTYGFESSDFIPPHFLIGRGCFLFRGRCSADRQRASLTDWLYPLSDLAEKESKFTFFLVFDLCPKITQVFCFAKIGDYSILLVKCQDTKWPFLSATSDVVLLSFEAVLLISYRDEPDCLLKNMDVGLLLPFTCAGGCRW